MDFVPFVSVNHCLDHCIGVHRVARILCVCVCVCVSAGSADTIDFYDVVSTVHLYTASCIVLRPVNCTCCHLLPSCGVARLLQWATYRHLGY